MPCTWVNGKKHALIDQFFYLVGSLCGGQAWQYIGNVA